MAEMSGWKSWQALCVIQVTSGNRWWQGLQKEGREELLRKRGKIQKAHKQYISSLICVWLSVRLCFFASQVGWFPSTYVEEEDWVCWLNDVHSASTQSWPTPVSAMLLCHSLCPASQMSLIKIQRLWFKRKAQCPQKPSPVLWQTLTQSRCQITDSRSVTPYLPSLRPCLPPRPTGKYMCCSQITLLLPYLLTLSYYWWLHWLVWDLPSLSSCFDTRKAQSPNWNTDPADSAAPKYATTLKCRSWGALTAVGTL